MSKYTCLTPIKFEHERYEEGDEIELNDKQAKPLLAASAIGPKSPAKPAKADEK